FALVWLALTLLTADAWRSARRSRVAEFSVRQVEQPRSAAVDA
ncbi:MAG: EamA family transporter RarD, partial [Streptomyces sp.]|nr:EamA family transporter RarD [Streptomyces sp.]